MRNLYFVRHGKPEFPEGQKCCIGWTDLPLSEEGRSQIRALSERFAAEPIEKIYTSPLGRCVESARILSGGTIPVELVEDMKEIGMGEWEALPFSVIKERYPEEYEARGRDIARFSPPGGESFSDCQKRAAAVFWRISRETRGNVVLMAHAGFNRALISHLEQRPLRELLSIPQEYGGVYTYPEYIFDGMIVAAGMSTRMGSYKPLMELAGKRVIDRELDTLREGGAREIAVITGYRAEELSEAVNTHSFEAPGSVACLHNPDYAVTKMFDSVSIGLRYFLKKWKSKEGQSLDGIFFLPVDVPLFTRFTMEWEKKQFARGNGDVYCPYHGGAPGHPLLIRASALEALLAHDGERGLKGAYERLGDRVIPLDMTDRGTVMDADTPEDFAGLENYAAARICPDEAMCQAILSWFRVPEHTVRHCRAVAELAVTLGREWNAAHPEERALDLDVLYAAGLLHDVAKGEPDHAQAGARWLLWLGHGAIAEAVADHMELPEDKQQENSESMVVYLADKMTAGDRRVTIEERFAPKREAFREQPEALAGLERRCEAARRAEALVCGTAGKGGGKG